MGRLIVLATCALGIAACAVGRNEALPPGNPGPRWDIGSVPTFDGNTTTPPTTPTPPTPQSDATVSPQSTPPDQGVHPDTYVPPSNPPPNPPPTSSGWGAGCASDANCQNGLFCILVIGKPTGYCTQRCAALGQVCPGTSGGQVAACIISAQDGNYCGFLCRTTDGLQHGCPGNLYCSPTDFPVGSGQHDCLAP